MKLLFCLECHDIRRFGKVDWVTCECGKSAGRYLEDLWFGEISGPAVALGFKNDDLKAIIDSPKVGITETYDFGAFVIPRTATTLEGVER